MIAPHMLHIRNDFPLSFLPAISKVIPYSCSRKVASDLLMSGMDILNDLDVSAASLDRAEAVTEVGLEELVGFLQSLPGFH